MWPQALGVAMQVAGCLFRGQNPVNHVVGNDIQYDALFAIASGVWAGLPTALLAKIGSAQVAVYAIAKSSLHDFAGLGLSEYQIFLEMVHYEIISFTGQQNSDFYCFLGVERTATHADIMTAYRNISAEIHASGSPQQVNGRLTEINLVSIVAGTLANQTARAQYDRVLRRMEGTQLRDMVFWAGTAFNLWLQIPIE